MVQTVFKHWLQGPPLTGWRALLGASIVLAIPTGIRAIVEGVVTGCEFTPYLPFVLLAAILLNGWQAGGVALAAVAIMGGMIGGPSHDLMHESCFQTSAGMFLASAAVLIGAAYLVRREFQSWGTDESAGGIVFSLRNDQVWASWYNSGLPVPLGSQEKVETMMADFLAQGDVAKRLAGKSD